MLTNCFALSARREDALQRDAEEKRQVRLQVIVRLVAARRSDSVRIELHQRSRRSVHADADASSELLSGWPTLKTVSLRHVQSV
jgi:hypothetical protein